MHTFGKIWEEQGLLNSKRKDLIHRELIIQTLEALRGPEQIAVVHLRGHQKGLTPQVRGNNIADREAKAKAAALLTLRESGNDTRENRAREEWKK